MNKTFKTIVKLLLWVVISVISLLLLVIALIQFPYFQNKIKDVAISYVQDKIGTPVRLDRIEIAFPKKIVIKGLYVESQEKDTLLQSNYIGMDISLFKLLSNTLEVSSIDLRGIHANIKRDSTGVFNFDYITKAFIDQNQPEQEQSDSGMDIRLADISLQDISFAFLDQWDGNFLQTHIGDFSTRVKNIDLEKQQYSVSKILLDGLKLTYTKQVGFAENSIDEESTQEQKQQTSSQELADVSLGLIDLKNFEISYTDKVSELAAEVLFKELELDIDQLDLNNQVVDINNIALETAFVKASIFKSVNKSNQVVLDSVKTPENDQFKDSLSFEIPWQLRVKDFQIKQTEFAFDNHNFKPIQTGLDPNHVFIQDFNLSLKDFQFSQNSVGLNLQDLRFKEKSGFQINKFKTYLLYDKQTSFIKDFYLETPNTKINSAIVLNYQSLQALSKDLAKTSLDIQIGNSFVGFKDIDLLLPGILKEYQLEGLLQEKVNFEVLAKGLVEDLKVERFFVKTLGSTFLNISGKVKSMPDLNKAYVDLNLKDFQTSSLDISRLLGSKIDLKQVEIPALLKLKGFVKGDFKNLNSDLQLNTSLGELSLKASFDQRIKNKEKYNLDLKVDNLALDKILMNSELGNLSFSTKVTGQGLDPKTALAQAELQVQQAQFKGYDYQNVLINAQVDQGKYQINWHNTDPNLQLDLQAKGVYCDNQISLALKTDLQNIDFNKLNLDSEPRVLTASISADMQNILPDSLVGKLEINDLGFVLEKRAYTLKPIVFTATADKATRQMNLTSQLLDFNMQGNYTLSSLSQAITGSLKSYFNQDHTDDNQKQVTALSQDEKQKEQQNFQYSLLVKYDPVIKDMLPDLTQLAPITMQGSYDQKTNYLSFKGEIPSLKYADFSIDNIYWDVKPTQDALGFTMGIQSISNAMVRLRGLNLQGDAKDNTLRYSLNLKDSKEQLCYVLSGDIQSNPDAIVSRIYNKGFMLDYQNWNVNPNNKIVWTKQGIYVQDFELSNQESSISIASEQNLSNSPLKLEFNNFNLATLTKTIQKDKLLASGYINGYVNLLDLSRDFRFVSDIDIANFSVLEMALGTLHIGVKNESLSKYLAQVSLKSTTNNLELRGVADLDSQQMDMKLDIGHLNTSFLAGLVPDLVSNAQGYFSSELNILGSFSAPKVLGSFKFNDVGLKVNSLNAEYNHINETISFTPTGMDFDKFSITDSDGNLLVINGQILTKTYTDFGFNLDIDAVDFKAVSSTAKDNDMYYGTLVFDTAMKIRGNMNKPVITGQILVGAKTDFTMVMPQEDPSIADREGIVEFVDQQSLQNAELMKYQEDFNNSEIVGLDISLAISVDKNATFSMIMDKSSGDKVVLKGEADLVGGIDPSGKITLSGRYEFDQGSYDLSFNMIKRKFEVQKGSSIIFAGDPTDAILDLTAIYQVNAAPIDLLISQMSSLSPSQQNMYKQKIPFQALLMMKGELLEPQISFDIKLKDDITSVSSDVVTNTNTKLAQLRNNEAEMNKQVFALLLLNHFIGENPFESSAGGISAGSIARQSVNRILSDQLNNLASSLISGVDLNFNLESSDDFSTGTKQSRTDLNVAVSKSLFSERLKVTVGSSFEVEGNQRANEQAANIAGDVELEYALSQDGRYLLRVYRKNRYEVALQGQVIETGVGFVITMSYTKFKELFERSKDKKELKRQLKEQSKSQNTKQE
ncbi:translocation/assembly module TamB domain-containing protein [Myroides sp. LJL119]